jgi:UDP-GlcNAc:undecaprenyl-phosphate GlcNAc-1-phosphate transferase
MPFVLAFGLALLLTPIAARVARVMSLVDEPSILDRGRDEIALKIHAPPIPVLGGAAVVVAVLGATWILDGRPPLSVSAAVGIALAAGTADDARPLPPWIRVQFQILAGLFLAGGGLRFGPEGMVGIAALAGLTVACANAVNLIDGQDGLAAGLGAIAALGLGIVAGGGWWIFGSATAGSLTGFLIWNRPPARIFLGNGGAYAVGVILAALAAAVTQAGGMQGLAAAASCLAVFAFELVTTIARRLRSRAPLTRGDRRHGYDLLAVRLGSRSRSTLTLYGVGVAAAVIGLLLGT